MLKVTDGVRLLATGLLLAGLAAAGGCKVKQTVAQSRELGGLRAQGIEADLAGRHSQSAIIWERYVDIRPQNADARFRYGRALLYSGRPAEAREQLQIAHDLDPEQADYVDALARAMHAAGDDTEMVALLERTAENEGTHEAYERWAAQAEEAGLADEAERALLAYADTHGSTSPEPHRRLAEFYGRRGDTEREIQRLRVTLSFDQNDQAAAARLRELGEIPGPTFALSPSDVD